MTKTELRQRLLFACMQNPSRANGRGNEEKDWPDAEKDAIIIALDTAEYICDNLSEEFDIDLNSE